jgi:hypothetical protein
MQELCLEYKHIVCNDFVLMGLMTPLWQDAQDCSVVDPISKEKANFLKYSNLTNYFPIV